MKKLIVVLIVILLSACSSNVLQSSREYNVSENEQYIFAWAEDVTFAKALHKCKENICLYYGYIDFIENTQERWLSVETSIFKVEIVDYFEIRDTRRRYVSIKISKSKNKHLIKRE